MLWPLFFSLFRLSLLRVRPFFLVLPFLHRLVIALLSLLSSLSACCPSPSRCSSVATVSFILLLFSLSCPYYPILHWPPLSFHSPLSLSLPSLCPSSCSCPCPSVNLALPFYLSFLFCLFSLVSIVLSFFFLSSFRPCPLAALILRAALLLRLYPCFFCSSSNPSGTISFNIVSSCSSTSPCRCPYLPFVLPIALALVFLLILPFLFICLSFILCSYLSPSSCLFSSSLACVLVRLLS